MFRIALGLAEAWVVSKIEFSQDQRQLELSLDFPSGSRFACPECGRGGCGVYDTSDRPTDQSVCDRRTVSVGSERTWRHLNFFEHKTRLHARQPRVKCPQHGVKTVGASRELQFARISE